MVGCANFCRRLSSASEGDGKYNNSYSSGFGDRISDLCNVGNEVAEEIMRPLEFSRDIIAVGGLSEVQAWMSWMSGRIFRMDVRCKR